MSVTYCNVTTDLTNAYREIDRYKGYFELDSTRWSVYSGSVYVQYETGYVSALFENGVPLTAVSSIANVNSERKYFYDSTNDALYVYCTSGANPNTKTIEAGETWNSFKTTCRNDAQEMLEGFLRSKFITPFQKVLSPRTSYNSESYDFEIRHATALLTCYLIIKRLNPDDKIADKLFKEVYNPDPEPEEVKGIVQQIIDGDVVLNIQQANRLAGGYNVYEGASNSGTGNIIVTGTYVGSQKEIWTVTIDNAGAVGTATFKFSRDGGTTWDLTSQDTKDDSVRRIHVADGIYIEFVGTFSLNDTWQIELFPLDEKTEISQFHSIRVER